MHMQIDSEHVASMAPGMERKWYLLPAGYPNLTRRTVAGNRSVLA
jgi:hypothetical protein